MELLLAQYHATGRVPEPSEISPIERFMRPAIYDTVAPSAVASGLPTLRMGRSLEDVICASSAAVDGGGSSDQLPRLAAFFAQDMYILNARVRGSGGWVVCVGLGVDFSVLRLFHTTPQPHLTTQNRRGTLPTRRRWWTCS